MSRRREGAAYIRRGGVGVALAACGVLALAACGSSGSSTTSNGLGGGSTSSSTAVAAPTSSASGSATSGSIVWSASPLTGTGANDARTVLINPSEPALARCLGMLDAAEHNELIDVAVVYFTMQICGVGFDELDILPKWPLCAFLFAQNAGYLVAFTAGGQTLGKMAVGIRASSTSSPAEILRRVEAAGGFVDRIAARLGLLQVAESAAMHEREVRIVEGILHQPQG